HKKSLQPVIKESHRSDPITVLQSLYFPNRRRDPFKREKYARHASKIRKLNSSAVYFFARNGFRSIKQISTCPEEMKCLAVHPSCLMYSKIYLRLEPLGLELVAAAAERGGHSVRFIDLQCESHRDFFELIEGCRPDV